MRMVDGWVMHVTSAVEWMLVFTIVVTGEWVLPCCCTNIIVFVVCCVAKLVFIIYKLLNNYYYYQHFYSAMYVCV